MSDSIGEFASRLRSSIALGLACLTAACAVSEPPDPSEFVDATLALLAEGKIETAASRIELGRRMYPTDGAIAACSATVADLLWRDEVAITELREVVNSKGRAGWSLAVARGRLGDQLFVAGRYGEALVPLLAGSVEDDAVRRRALVTVARELPFRRKQIGPLATEQKLLDGHLTEFLCAVGDLRRPFAIDTGSSITTVSRSLAMTVSARAIVEAGSVPDGTGQPVPISLGVIDQFAVGDVWLGTVPVAIIDDERLSMRDLFGGPDRVPAGILGLDILTQFRMTLDPVRGSVLLELPRSLPEVSSIQCVRSGGRCLLPVVIEGRRMWFVLDTGASHSSLTPAGLEVLDGGAARASPGFRRVRTAGGRTLSVRQVRNLVLRVSQTRFPGVDLPVVPRLVDSLFPVHGVLGVDLLRNCRLTLDRGRARLEIVQPLARPLGGGND